MIHISASFTFLARSHRCARHSIGISTHLFSIMNLIPNTNFLKPFARYRSWIPTSHKSQRMAVVLMECLDHSSEMPIKSPPAWLLQSAFPENRLLIQITTEVDIYRMIADVDRIGFDSYFIQHVLKSDSSPFWHNKLLQISHWLPWVGGSKFFATVSAHIQSPTDRNNAEILISNSASE